MNNRNYVAPVPGGYIGVVNGMEQGRYSDLNQAQDKDNQTNGPTSQPSASSLPAPSVGGNINVNAWAASLGDPAAYSLGPKFVQQYGRLPTSIAEWNAFKASSGAGGGGGGGAGGYTSAMTELARLLGISLPDTNQQFFDWDKEQYNRTLAEQQRQFNAQQEMQGKAQYSSLAQSLLGGAASLRGPRDWLKYAGYTTGGRDIINRLYGSEPAPAFGAPTGVSKPATMGDILSKLGLM